MQPIDPQALSTVTGGFLGALLSAAPGILQGVSGIIAASKSGRGGAPAQASAAPPPQAAPAPAAQPPTQMASAPSAAASCACCCDPLRSAASVSTMVQIG